MAPSVAASVTDRPVLICRSRPNRRLSLSSLLLAAVLLSALALLLPGVHGARALDDVKEAKEASINRMMMTQAAAVRWPVTVREGGGGHGAGHASGGHGHSGGTGHGSGHGRAEPAGHNTHRRSAAPGRDLGLPMAAASCAFLAATAAVALLRS